MTFEGESGDGAIQLPAREAEILGLAARGLTDKQISARLGISRDTVSTYWRRILLRYKAANRTEVVARAIQSELKEKVEEAQRTSQRLESEMRQMSRTDSVENANRRLLYALNDCLLSFVSQARSPEEIFRRLLDEFVTATNSEFGFISELVNADGDDPSIRNLALSNISWNESSRSAYEKEFRYNLQSWNSENLTAAVHARRSTVIINQFPADGVQTSVPDGHRSIECFLGIPIFEGDDIVGVMGVANSDDGYDGNSLPDLSPLATTCAALIASLRQEDRKTT